MNSLLSRLHTSNHQPNNTKSSPAAHTPRTELAHAIARRSRDPNSTDYRFNINQKCIYERRLPGGSYITAHVQRLQSGYYDSPLVHEDRIENVRFVALNFVFHPAKSTARFKSAEIRLALRRCKSEHPRRDSHRHSAHSHGRDSGRSNTNSQRDRQPYASHDPTDVSDPQTALIRSSDALALNSPSQNRHFKSPADRIRSLCVSPPRFLRHAPHLLFGAISPETLTWNFNLAGQHARPPSAAARWWWTRMLPWMRGLHRPLHGGGGRANGKAAESWNRFGEGEDLEDGEIVWTLEENRLQKSGLPREFTFVVLLTKGCGPDTEEEGGELDVSLDLEIRPVVGGWMGLSNASVPGLVNNLVQFRPLHKEGVDLDRDIGQRFQPEEREWGFNFAKLASEFDDFIWLPGSTWATSEHGERRETGASSDEDEKAAGGEGAGKKQETAKKRSSDQAPQLPMLTNGDNTLNLRVILDHATSRGINVASPSQNASSSLPYATLRPQQPQPPYAHSRGPSPLYAVPPATSTSGSRRSQHSSSIQSSRLGRGDSTSKRRSITITSSPLPQPVLPDHTTPETNRQLSRSPTLRRRTSRSSLDKAYHSSPSSAAYITPLRTRPFTIHDDLPSENTTPLPTTSDNRHTRFPSMTTRPTDQRPRSWYDHRSSPEPDSTSSSSQPQPQTKHHPLQPPPLRSTDSSASQNTVLRFIAPPPRSPERSPTHAATERPGGITWSSQPSHQHDDYNDDDRGGNTYVSGLGAGDQEEVNGVDKEKEKKRVSVRGSNVSQTPYPFSPEGTAGGGGGGGGFEQPLDDEEEVGVTVPQIKVPRKSSKRVSGLQYVVAGNGVRAGTLGEGVKSADGSGSGSGSGSSSGSGSDKDGSVAVISDVPSATPPMGRAASGVFHDAAEELDTSSDGNGAVPHGKAEKNAVGGGGDRRRGEVNGDGNANANGNEGKSGGDALKLGEGEFDASNVI